jgi:hypothetical protein
MKDTLAMYKKLILSSVSKEAYPLYASYITSDPGSIRVCNNSSYIQINKSLPFKGSTNVFVLMSLLDKMPDEGVEYKFTKTDLAISYPGFSTKLNVVDLNVPKLELQNEEFVDIDSTLLSILGLAKKFTGKDDIAKNVLVAKDGIYSTDNYRAFIYNKDIDVGDDLLFLDNKIISVLEEGFGVGISHNNNVGVTFPGGFGIFTTEPVRFYPNNKIRNFMLSLKKNNTYLCTSEQMQECMDKLSPIFFGESKKMVTIESNDSKVFIKGASRMNGEARIFLTESSSDLDLNVAITIESFKDIPLTHEVYASKVDNFGTCFYTTDGDCEIAFLEGGN